MIDDSGVQIVRYFPQFSIDRIAVLFIFQNDVV